MKRHYCTYFDKNYLVKALAMIESLSMHEKGEFVLFAVCLDELTRLTMEKLHLPNVIAVPLHEIERNDRQLQAAKKNRTLVEYYWTLTPTVIERIFEMAADAEVVTYLDADLFFYSSPDPIFRELSGNSVLIHGHRFSPELAELETYGKYNVGLLCFRNDSSGRQALDWWRDRCIEWCYDRIEDGKYGDQLYLNDWPERFANTRVLENIGAGVAPWNHAQYGYSCTQQGNVLVDAMPLVFYHFHAFTFVTPDIVIPAKIPHYLLKEEILRLIVLPYLYALSRAIDTCRQVFPDFNSGLCNDKVLTNALTFVARKELASAIREAGITHPQVELDAAWDCYYTKQMNQLAAGPSPGEFEANHAVPSPPPSATAFAESKLAHQWLDGLKGVEIGPSAHNPFGLATRNVGLKFEGYEQEQKDLTGEIAPLHIIAPADDIPLLDDSEDFVLSSHVIEHCPDMIKTLVEWYRVTKKNGYIYMIVPFRDAAATDKGRPLTEWDHMVDDYRNGVTDKTEPAANGIPFGYCHYHVFDIDSMHGFVRQIFGNRLELVAHQECDDKIGNGFTLVYRKTRSFSDSFPWALSDGAGQTEIRRSVVAATRDEACAKIVVAANLVPFKDAGQQQRQQACITSITALAGAEIMPLNICYPDEILEPAGWQIAPVLQRSANAELKVNGKRKPFVSELFDIASAWAAERGITWFAVTNSDIVLTEALFVEVNALLTAGYETIAISRNEVERVDPVQGLVPGYLEVNGYDIFVCRTDWWQNNRRRFQSYIYGERAWDDAYAAIMACHSRFSMLYKDGLCFHFKHPTDWLTGPYADYNMQLYLGTDKKYSERYEAFIQEVLRVDKAQLSCGTTEVLLQKHFTIEEQANPMRNTRPTTKGFVNICMITYNRIDFTRQAIAALVACTDYPHTITVVDNASSDGTREYLQALKEKGVIKNLVLLDENVGVAKASNLAWHLEPEAEYYLKLDNDIVIQKNGWLSPMVDVIEKVPQLGAVAYNFEPVSIPLQTVNGFSIRIKNQGNLGGACILIPKRTEQLLGYWCEDYGLYGEEDADYGFRIMLAELTNAYMEDEAIGLHLPAGRAASIDMQSLVATDGLEEKEHAEYRHWKDSQRRHNVQSGSLANHYAAYQSGERLLRVESAFAKGWAHNNLPPQPEPLDSASKATESHQSSNKLKVAVFSLDLPNYACGHIRLAAPSASLSGQMELNWEVKLEAGRYNVDNINIIKEADLIVIQRFFPRKETEDVINRILASGKPVIYETDDLLTDIPAGNGSHLLGEKAAFRIQEFLPKVQAVTVSTENLAKVYRQYNRHIHVLPNLIDETLWTRTSPAGCDKLVICYAGTPTHQDDLAIIEEALERIAVAFADRVTFKFIGCTTKRISRIPGFSFLEFNAAYSPYAQFLQKTEIDIALAPLKDNQFNRCKSNIKWLEYSACGIAGVYSDLPPYNTSVRNGETGLLVENNADAWYRAIETLILDAELRKKMARKAREEVLDNYTLAAGAHRYLETYRRIAEGKPAESDYKCSIVIPVFNQAELTKQCLAALPAATGDSLHYEVIIVDNASTDGTAAFLETLGGDVRIIRNRENLGFAKACNQGGRAATGEYIVFLNNDTIPKAGWLEALVRGVEEDGADICGARLLYPDNRVQHAGVAFDERGIGYHIFNGFPANHPAVMEKRFMQCVTGACLLLCRQLFTELGGFDEGYRNGYEDVDLCLRSGEKGYRVLYVPESVVTHFEESTPGRKDHDNANARRYLSRWQGKVRCDDNDFYHAAGYRKELAPEGHYAITRIPAEERTEPMNAQTPPIDLLKQNAAKSLFALGKGLKEASRFEEAREALEMASRLGNRDAQVEIADCRAAEGKIDEAAALYRDALAADTDNPRALLGMGVINILRGQNADAAACFSRVLNKENSNSKALCGLGMARRMEGQEEEAFIFFKQALISDPENLSALHELVKSAYGLGRYQEVAEHLRTYLMYHPADADILYSMAGLLYKGGQLAEAQEALERLLVISPEYEGGAELMARITADAASYSRMNEALPQLRRVAG